jgi:uncharacterized protein YqeY
MSLKDKIMEDIKSAMKEKNQEKLSTLRFLHSAINNKEIEVRPNTVTDADVVAVIQKSVKQRKESVDQYQKANRQDLADKELAEIKILDAYMPTQMNEDEIKSAVAAAIKTLNASTIKDMGAVMKEVTAKTQGRADNKIVSQIVRSSLS